MDISNVGSGLAADTFKSQYAGLVARKSLDLQKQQGQNALALIQTAIPDLGNGNGKLVNIRV